MEYVSAWITQHLHLRLRVHGVHKCIKLIFYKTTAESVVFLIDSSAMVSLCIKSAMNSSYIFTYLLQSLPQQFVSWFPPLSLWQFIIQDVGVCCHCVCPRPVPFINQVKSVGVIHDEWIQLEPHFFDVPADDPVKAWGHSLVNVYNAVQKLVLWEQNLTMFDILLLTGGYSVSSLHPNQHTSHFLHPCRSPPFLPHED